jgi:hypothetical protein
VRDAEIDAAAAREDLVANRLRHRIGIRIVGRERFREGDAHLHRTARAHRIAVGQQRLAERHPADEVLVQLAQLLLRFHRVEAIAIALAIR